ncbi:beta-glucanosyltransferase [Cadophora malorum]|uniref:1,3-beta-glucanosyltransferase n=1 Tax=Cadophora malorum TaxID=108018 RepID=A0A8H7T8R3_9HELO|nr:beta-glucanosyltransferase [Cadophora malorum]
MKPSTISALLGSLFFATSAAASPSPVLAPRATSVLTPVTITGNAFYRGNERFYIRGVDYQPGGGTGVESDPIANATACKRDIPYFTKLGINTIRVYAVDNSKNHDECMAALAEAGIYLVLDTDTSKYSLNREDPKESYNSVYLQSVFATIDAFANYTNTLAFLSGNEVINNVTNTDCAPYVKAVTRDMKQYIGSRGYRSVPVGYSAADVAENQEIMANYMNCGTDDQRSDFYAINDYSWCDPSSFTTSGWDTLVANYTGYGIPLFMSEFGCITNTRTFEEVAALYNTSMTNVFSGGLVYEYSEEGNGYGLVTIDGDTVSTNADYNYLSSAYAQATNPTGNGGATSTSASTTCPTESADWDVANDNLPAIPAKAEEYMSTGAGTGPGLDGSGSQEAGTADNESTGTASAGSGTVTETASASSTKKSAGAKIPAVDTKAFMVVATIMLSMLSGMVLL